VSLFPVLTKSVILTREACTPGGMYTGRHVHREGGCGTPSGGGRRVWYTIGRRREEYSLRWLRTSAQRPLPGSIRRLLPECYPIYLFDVRRINGCQSVEVRGITTVLTITVFNLAQSEELIEELSPGPSPAARYRCYRGRLRRS